jgi:heme A synthase
MRSVYKVLAYLVAAEVVVQAMAIAYALAGLGNFVDHGGVFDKAADSGGKPFPEFVGFMVHGVNGYVVVPVIALLLLVSSFFARVPRGASWAGLVFGLVLLQAMLGGLTHSLPAAGALHGLNALALFTAALYTALRVRRSAPQPAAQPQAGVTTAA